MGNATSKSGIRSPGVALASELREVARRLNANEVSDDGLREARELAVRMQRLLKGDRRSRWYESGSEADLPSQECQDAYLGMSPIRGQLNPVAPPLRIELGAREDGRPCVRGSARLPSQYEGPPQGVHGGWVAALLDDVLGHAQSLAKRNGVTASLHVKYRKVTPIDEDLRLEAWVHEEDGRRTLIRATCHAGDELTAEAEGLFIAVDFEQMRARMGERQSVSRANAVGE